MVDHLRTKGNRNVFIAVLAATLTTVGALSVIRFLGENSRLQLKDFSFVLIASLSVSLAVALFLVPSLMELVGLGKGRQRRRLRSLRRAARFGRIYGPVMAFSQRFRWIYIIGALLLFGLPVHKLPTRMEGEEWYHKLYRSTLASETYVQKIKPVADKLLGGTLRIFTTKVSERYRYREPERTAINVTISLPQGATLEQMNDLAVETERYLKQYEQIDQFTTQITGARRGYIRVTFKPEYELGAFPYILYSQLLSLANLLTGADWNVTGVGQYFSNSVGESVGDQQITLYGYNFEELNGYARQLMEKVMEHPRAAEPYIIGESERWGMRDMLYEYRLTMDPARLQAQELTPLEVYSYLEGYSIRKSADASVFVNGRYEPIRLKSEESDRFDLWMMHHTPIDRGGRMVRLSELGTLNKDLANKTITKENQQYILTIAYRFQGAYRLAEMHRKRVIEEIAARLPVGYYIKEAGYSWWERENNKQFMLILLVIVIIYVITSILLESLIQPLAVVLIIPISFVGVFLTFYGFNLGLDQGAFASFVLLSGIVVNAALYILNDYNISVRQAPPGLSLQRLYLKAYQGKIIPITLTVLSTVLGLVPFITEGQDEVFWFSLAAGTMGGLIFSILAIIVFLPAFLPLKHRKHNPDKS
jgi:multidrug efflux pump subunit AcrB